MTTSELCYLSATEALVRFKDKSLSPVELLDAVITQSERTEPVINAFSADRFDQARTQAKTIEKKYLCNDESLGALEGIPLVMKDEAPMAENAA